MNLLDRYIFKQFFKNLLLVLSSLVAIYLLVDFFERIDNFTEKGKPFSLAIKYFLLKIPFIYDQMSPVCILLAGIITLGLLNRNRELMSLSAGGISLIRIILPIIAASVLFTMGTVVVAQWILPHTNETTNNIWYQEVNNRFAKGIERDDRIFFQGETGIYSFKRSDPNHYYFSDFNYTAWDSEYTMQTLLTAKKAKWQNEKWSFSDGQLKTTRPDGEYNITLFNKLDLPLPNVPAEFFVAEYRVKELSLYQLHKNGIAALKKGDLQGLVDVNRRFSFIFLGIPLLVLALPALLYVHQKWQKELTMTVPMSCAIAFIAWGGWSATQSLSQAAYINPFVASWTIHVVLLLTGVTWIARINNR